MLLVAVITAIMKSALDDGCDGDLNSKNNEPSKQ